MTPHWIRWGSSCLSSFQTTAGQCLFVALKCSKSSSFNSVFEALSRTINSEQSAGQRWPHGKSGSSISLVSLRCPTSHRCGNSTSITAENSTSITSENLTSITAENSTSITAENLTSITAETPPSAPLQKLHQHHYRNSTSRNSSSITAETPPVSLQSTATGFMWGVFFGQSWQTLLRVKERHDRKSQVGV